MIKTPSRKRKTADHVENAENKRQAQCVRKTLHTRLRLPEKQEVLVDAYVRHLKNFANILLIYSISSIVSRGL